MGGFGGVAGRHVTWRREAQSMRTFGLPSALHGPIPRGASAPPPLHHFSGGGGGAPFTTSKISATRHSQASKPQQGLNAISQRANAVVAVHATAR